MQLLAHVLFEDQVHVGIAVGAGGQRQRIERRGDARRAHAAQLGFIVRHQTTPARRRSGAANEENPAAPTRPSPRAFPRAEHPKESGRETSTSAPDLTAAGRNTERASGPLRYIGGAHTRAATSTRSFGALLGVLRNYRIDSALRMRSLRLLVECVRCVHGGAGRQAPSLAMSVADRKSVV